MKKMTSYNELGRTLTETLAMLAIVGILSVIGMRGYTSAMDKSRANNLIQEAQKRAVIVAGQIGFNNQTPSLAEFSPYNTTSSGTFGEVKITGLTGQFGIQVSNVSKSICQNILNTIGDKTPIRRLSHETTPTTPITSCDEDNAFLFIYNNDMTGDDKVEPPTTCRTVNDCKTSCATCEIPEDEEVGVCTNECEEPVRLCQTDNDCNVDNECNVCDTESGLCRNGCERVQYLESTGTQYIDTGIVPTSSMNAKIDFYIPSTTPNTEQHILGAMAGSGNKNGGRYQFLGFLKNAGDRWRTAYGELTANDNNWGKVIYDEKVHFDITLQNGTSTVYINNSTTPDWTLTYEEDVITPSSIHMFALNFGGQPYSYSTCRVYSCSISHDNTLVRNFIPVIAPNGKACMFNKVKEDGKLKLYCNAGSGDFKTNKD